MTMITYNPSQIILVKFPFSDLSSSKKRPALVLNHIQLTSDIGLVTISMITSRIDGIKLVGDYRIQKWKESGLLHPSLVRLSKIATIEQQLVEKPLGSLYNPDLSGFKRAFKKYFDFWL